jgi:hypothetical protein
MRNNLNKKFFLYLIVLIFISTLKANDDFQFKFKFPNIKNQSNYQKVNLKQPIYFEFEIKQTKYKDNIMFFKFNPIKNDNFDIHFLNLNEVDKFNNKKLVYSYLIYPKSYGKKRLDFSLLVQRTNEEGLKPGYEGDRDNVLGMVSKDSYENIAPLLFDVKKVAIKQTHNFKLTYNIKKRKIKPYEPIYITYTISGEGYPLKVEDLFKKNNSYKYFLDKPIKKIFHTKNGSKIKYIFKYAFISKEDFKIPAVNILNLKTPSIDIKVIKPNIKTLLDKNTKPQSAKESNKNYFEIMIYLLIFISGFITGKLLDFNIFKKFKKDNNNLKKEIVAEDIKDKKERLFWMISKDKHLYKKQIKELEMQLYKDNI